VSLLDWWLHNLCLFGFARDDSDYNHYRISIIGDWLCFSIWYSQTVWDIFLLILLPFCKGNFWWLCWASWSMFHCCCWRKGWWPYYDMLPLHALGPIGFLGVWSMLHSFHISFSSSSSLITYGPWSLYLFLKSPMLHKKTHLYTASAWISVLLRRQVPFLHQSILFWTNPTPRVLLAISPWGLA